MKKLIVIPFYFLSIIVTATRYYVKSSGNDSNTGLSDVQAWKTISKVNSSAFSAGDSILFSRGDEWREGVIVSNSGSTNSYITYTAYGTGNDPIINGSDILTGWTEHSTNVWETSCDSVIDYIGSGYDYMVIVDGSMYIQVATLKEVNIANTFFIDKIPNPDNVYIYSNTDPATKTAEVSARKFGFFVNNKTFIKLAGLEFRNAAHSGAFFYGSERSQVIGNSIIDNCTFYRNRNTGIEFFDGYSNNIVQNCSSSYNGNGYYSASYTNWGSDDNIFRKCYAGYNIHYRVGLLTDGHGFGIYNSDDCIVEYCEAEHSWYGIIIDPNDNPNDFICRYNYVHDTDPEEAGIKVGENIPAGTVHQVYNNLIVNSGGGTIYPYGIAVGGQTRDGSIYVLNNTVYTDGSKGQIAACIMINGAKNVTLKNNIMYSGGGAGEAVLLVFYPDPSFVSDYNLFYLPNISTNIFLYNTTPYHTLSAWQDISRQDTHSIYGDPLFINNTSDWELQPNSLAINAGTNVGFIKDLAGNPLVGAPDIGAYEYQLPNDSGVILEGRQEHLIIYPNPSNGKFDLYLKEENTHILKLSVFDITGKIVCEENLELNNSESPRHVDISNRPSGIYFVVLSTDKGTYNQLVVVD